MREIVENLPVYMMIGIVVVVVVSQIHRLAGALLGVLFWIAVAWIGRAAYEMDGAIGIANLRFSRGTFHAICVGFIVLNAGLAYSWFATQRRRRSPPEDPE